MTNPRLRAAMMAADFTAPSLAEATGVDPKTVTRWLTQDRLPHPRTRHKIATALGIEETYLWPELLERSGGHTEILEVYATRTAVPGDVWQRIVTAHDIDVLVYSGGFLIETFDLPTQLQRVSAEGGTGRVLLGDPGSEEVHERAVTEGLPSLPSRAQSSAEYLRRAAQLPGIELRTHDTPLYVSIYRGDDLMAVNAHTYGLPAMDNPVYLLQRVPGCPLFPYYEAAFERVWDSATPR